MHLVMLLALSTCIAAPKIYAAEFSISPFLSYLELSLTEKRRANTSNFPDDVYILPFFLEPQALFQGEKQVGGFGMGLELGYELNGLLQLKGLISRNRYLDHDFQIEKSHLDRFTLGMGVGVFSGEVISVGTHLDVGTVKLTSEPKDRVSSVYRAPEGIGSKLDFTGRPNSTSILIGSLGLQTSADFSEFGRLTFKISRLNTLRAGRQRYEIATTRTDSDLYVSGTEFNIQYSYLL